MKSYNGFDKPYIYAAFPEEDTRSLSAMEAFSESVTFHFAQAFKKSEGKYLEGAWAVLLFADRTFVQSERFHTIVDNACALGKSILCVQLEDLQDSPWFSMQLGSSQAIYAKDMDGEALVEALKKAEIFNGISVTEAQKRFAKRRSLTMIFAPVAAAVVIFGAVVYPLMIAPVMKQNRILQQWGLNREDLENITELYIVGNNVYPHFVHAWYQNEEKTLMYVNVANEWSEQTLTEGVAVSAIEDLSVLKKMPNLRVLYLEGLQITDISTICEVKSLCELGINCNPVTSLEGIGNLKNLQSLSIACTDVVDLTPVGQCSALESLQMDITDIADLSPLKQCPAMVSIRAGNTKVRDLQGISGMRTLRDLHLNDSDLQSLAGAQDCPSLEVLDVRNTRVSDVRPLQDLKRLADFNGSDTPIAKIPVLHSTASRRASVDMRQCSNLRDYSELANIPSFDYLNLDDVPAETLLPYIEGKPIAHLLWAGLDTVSLEALSGVQIAAVGQTTGGELNLAWSKLETLDGIEHFKNIEALDLKYAFNLEDLTPILELESLEYLTVSSDMRDRVESQLQNAHFEIEYRDD